MVLVVIFGFYKTIPLIGEAFSKAEEIKSKQESVADLNKNIEIAKKNNIEAMKSEPDTKLIFQPQVQSQEPMVAFSEMLDTVLELAKESGLKIKTIEFKDIPESDPVKQNHASTHNAAMLNTQLIGTYTELQTFLREVYRYQYLIGIQKVEITPYERDKKILIIDLSLALYSKK